MTTTTSPRCPGSSRGTSLGTFTIRSGQSFGECGVCDRQVSIAIDGRAVAHAALTSR